MPKKFAFALLGLVIVLLALGLVKRAQIVKISSVPHVMPASAVTSYEAKTVAWQPVISAIGTLAPVEGVMLSADADGIVVNIAADSGTSVKAGDLILSLDTSVEDAQLKAAEAAAELSKLQHDRAAELIGKNTISQAELDNATAQLNQANANVAALKATIARKHVRAPFDGRVGIRLVNVGQFVSRGRDLLPIQRLDPIYVNFNVPQHEISSLTLGQKISVTVDGFHQPFEGKISAINSQVDPATRNIGVQALMANPAEQLRAGMFVQVEVELPLGAPQVVLPATAIAYAPYGNSVYIIENMKGHDGKEYLGVRQQIVKLGTTRGDLIAIEEGVKPGEQVVTAGVFKLRNGSPVQVNNTVQPAASSKPKPDNT